jgi:hypothetical protein
VVSPGAPVLPTGGVNECDCKIFLEHNIPTTTTNNNITIFFFILMNFFIEIA